MQLVGFMHVLEGCRHTRVGHSCSRRVVPSTAQTPGCRFRARQCRSPCLVIRGDQEGKRIDGSQLRAPLRAAVHGLRFFTVYGPGVAQTWRCSSSPKKSSRTSDPVFTAAKWCAISPMSTTSSRGLSESWEARAPRPAERRSPGPRDKLCSWRIFNIGNNQPVKLMR